MSQEAMAKMVGLSVEELEDVASDEKKSATLASSSSAASFASQVN